MKRNKRKAEGFFFDISLASQISSVYQSVSFVC